MASISGKETKPEISVRSFLFKQGFRFRKNVKTLPGKPDIVLRKYQTIIFVHGCFWHGHKHCKKAKRPTSNVRFWISKIDANCERDKRVTAKLRKLGWNVIVIWECTLKSREAFAKAMKRLYERLSQIQWFVCVAPYPDSYRWKYLTYSVGRYHHLCLKWLMLEFTT